MTLFALTLLVIWELNHPNPILNLRLLGEPTSWCAGSSFFFRSPCSMAATSTCPRCLQELFGYDATRAGLVMSPAAFFTMAAMPVVGYLLGKGVDARYLVPIGLICVAGSSYWSAHLNLDASAYAIVAPRCLLMLGVGFLFVPLNNAAYLYLPRNQINNATGLFNMLRNEGGSLGIAIAATMLGRQQPSFIMPGSRSTFAPPTRGSTRWSNSSPSCGLSGAEFFLGGRTRSGISGLLSRMVSEQARVLAYLDIFWLFWVMILATIPLLFLMKRSVARGELAAH